MTPPVRCASPTCATVVGTGRSEQVAEDEMDGVGAEVTSVKETAERIANGDVPEGADHTRVLAGLIKQLAEQVERLAGGQQTQG
jgi:hypothetical protein